MILEDAVHNIVGCNRSLQHFRSLTLRRLNDAYVISHVRDTRYGRLITWTKDFKKLRTKSALDNDTWPRGDDMDEK